MAALSAQAQLRCAPKSAMTAAGDEPKRIAVKWSTAMIALGFLLTIVWLGLRLFHVCRQRSVDRLPLLGYHQRSRPQLFNFVQTHLGQGDQNTFHVQRSSKVSPFERCVMVGFAVIGFLVGTALSNTKVLVLVPAIPLMLAIVTAGKAVRGETILWMEVTMILVATSVQLGYFFGGIFRFAVDEKSLRDIKARAKLTS